MLYKITYLFALLLLLPAMSFAKMDKLITCNIDQQIISSEKTSDKMKTIPLDQKQHGKDPYRISVSKLDTNNPHAKGLMPGWSEGNFIKMESPDDASNEYWFYGQPIYDMVILHLVKNGPADWDIYAVYLRPRFTVKKGIFPRTDATYFGKCK